ncbi:MAG: glycosyl hydrolase [Bacteroidales bacterium]
MRKYILVLLTIFPLLIRAQQPEQTLSWPAVRPETKPWTRWWWPGSIATKDDMKKALTAYTNAGLGGLELTVLYGVRGQEDKFVNFLSPAWMDMFQYILQETASTGLGIDLANSSSWPFGGPWVTDNDAAKYLAHKTYILTGGERLGEKVAFTQEPFIRWSGTYRTDIENITDPVSSNRNLQELSVDQIRFKKQIPFILLMAYSDNGQIIDLTEKVNSDGELDWVAPEGRWTLHALFEGWHGKMVERAGPGGEGYVIDHFSSTAIKDYLDKFDKAFKGYNITSLRGFFNDSYEVDDARGQSDWTPGFFSEFKERRGYDLKNYLPALFQKDSPEMNARVLCDYRQTISDLILDNFTRGWTSWANKKGKVTRNQSHGSPANILDLYAASDIPETEGTDILRSKFATSAANVTGKKLVSAEAATWLGEHFTSTLADVRKNVDNYFIAGVNHVFYHGTCFSPASEPWPGFQFYAAVEFSPANPIWADFNLLNQYVTRVQSVLQNTTASNDILLYFPVFDRFSDYNNLLLEHFDAISPKFNGTNFRKAADMMLTRGYSFDYISDLQLSNVIFTENSLYTGGSPYQTIILPDCKYIPVSTFNRFINLADKGATIIIYGEFPGDVPGLSKLEENRELYSFLKSELQFGPTGVEGLEVAKYGNGRILKGNDLEKLLEAAAVRREMMTDSGLEFTRRHNFKGNWYFIKNNSGKAYSGNITLATPGKSVAVFNPSNGEKGIVKGTFTKSNTSFYIKLDPEESLVIAVLAKKTSGTNYRFYQPAGEALELPAKWHLRFIEGGPVLPGEIELERLQAWTELAGTDYKDFSGTAEYSARLDFPDVKADAWLINLGEVHESARVFLNGREIAGLIGPSFTFVVKKNDLKAENNIKVRVTNLAANRIAALDRANVNWKEFYNVNFPARLPQNRKNGIFDASSWEPRVSGLKGPVTITPVQLKK